MKFYPDQNYSIAEIAQFFKSGGLDSVRPFSSLAHFLHGFGLNAQKDSTMPFQHFNYWVKVKLNSFGSTAHWTVAILECCQHDENRALEYFFELLHEFSLLKVEKALVAQLKKENFLFYYSNEDTYRNGVHIEGRIIHSPAPYSVKLFAFDYCVHAYHFDYHYEIGKVQSGFYEGHYANLSACLNRYKEVFAIGDWIEIPASIQQDLFNETATHCKNWKENNI